MAFNFGGFMPSSGGRRVKMSQLLAQMPDPNNGTTLGGLGSVLQRALMGYQMGQDMASEQAAQDTMKQAGQAMMGTPASTIQWNTQRPEGVEPGPMETNIAAKPGDRNLAMSLLMGNERTAPYGMQMAQDDQKLGMERTKLADERAWREKAAPRAKVVGPDGKGKYVPVWEADGAEPYDTPKYGTELPYPADVAAQRIDEAKARAGATMPQWVPQQTPNGPVLVNPKTGDMKVDPSAPPPPSASDRSKLKEAEVGAQSIKSALWDYRDARTKADLPERLKSVAGLGTDLNTKYNNTALMAKGEALFNLGVLNGPDLSIIRRTLSDPSTIRDLANGNESVMSQVTALEKLLDDRLTAYRQQYGGQQPPSQPAQAGQGTRPRAVNPATGQVVEFDGQQWGPAR